MKEMKKINYEAVISKAFDLMKDKDPRKDSDNFDKEANELYEEFFKDIFLSAKVDLQGHCKGKYDGKTLKEITDEFEYDYLPKKYEDNIKAILSFWILDDILKNKGNPKEGFEKSIIETLKKETSDSFYKVEHHCFICGVGTKSSYRDGEFTNKVNSESRLSTFESHQACKYPNGIEDYEYKMSIPSGELIFANDLRALYPELENLEDDKYITEKSGYYNSINSELGVKYNQEYWNNRGMIYVQVGNTSPSIFKNKETGEITVKNRGFYIPESETYKYKEEDFEKEYDDGYIKNYTDKEEDLGSVCTDLWAVCGIDKDLMKSLCEERGLDFEKFKSKSDCISVIVEPGEYIIKSFNAYRYENKKTFFSVKKV